MSSLLLSENETRSIFHEQGKVPPYHPSPKNKAHLLYILKLRADITKYYNRLGLFREWARVEELYENSQKAKIRGELSPLNIGAEIELIETKSSEEKKVMPEVVVKPRYEEGRTKAEAIQETVERIKNNPYNKDELKKCEMLDAKNIYGIAYQKIYWREVWKTVKEVTETKKHKGADSEKIPNLKWKENRVLAYKDIAIDNIPPQNLLWSKNADSFDEAHEWIEIWSGDYDSAEHEFGMFKNFKYVRKGAYPKGIDDALSSWTSPSSIKKLDDFKNVDCVALTYYNDLLDEKSILLNGVLLTQYGSPIPSKYWKSAPYASARCRNMVGERKSHPKGDVILVERLKELKSSLVNAAAQAVLTNSNSVLITTKEVAAKLKALGKIWQQSNIIEATSKEHADATKPLSVQSDPSGVLALIGRIDEMIITLTGVDTRALISSVQETATKSAIRSETAIKRINAGIKLLEHDYLYRRMQIILALVREHYEEEEVFLDDKTLGDKKPKQIRIPKTIPVKGKRYTWVRKVKPIPVEQMEELIALGLSPECADLIFDPVDKKDPEEFLWEVNTVKKLNRLKKFQLHTKAVKDSVIGLMEKNSCDDLEKTDLENKDEVSDLEVRKDLFVLPYEIEIVPRGSQTYSEAFTKERIEKIVATVSNPLLLPFVKGRELIQKLFASEGWDESMLNTEEETAKIQNENAERDAMSKGGQGADQQKAIRAGAPSPSQPPPQPMA